jgi:hypothetical protein
VTHLPHYNIAVSYRSAADIVEGSDRMGDPARKWMIFILLFNIDEYIYCFMSQYMQYYM